MLDQHSHKDVAIPKELFMNLLKKLFAKKTEKTGVELEVLFNPLKIKHPEKYWSAFFKVFNAEATPSNGDQIEILFGSTDTTHIVYYCYEDVYVLMQPENDGWTATSVWAAGFEGADEIAAKTNTPFLFKFKNPFCFRGFVNFVYFIVRE